MQTMMLSPDNTVFMIKPGAPVRIGNPLLPLMTLIKGTTIHQRRRFTVCLCSRSSAGLWRSRGTSLSGSISIANEALLMLQNTFLMSCRNSKRCRCVSFCSGGGGTSASLMLLFGLNSPPGRQNVNVSPGCVPAGQRRTPEGAWRGASGAAVSFVRHLRDLRQI